MEPTKRFFKERLELFDCHKVVIMKKAAFKKIFVSPLGRRLFLAILLFSSVITLLITILQIHTDYKEELSVIDFQIEQIKSTTLQSLSHSVWVTDDIQGQKLLNGIIQFSYVNYAAIISAGETKWSAGNAEIENAFISRFPLTYSHRGSKVKIAELIIKGSLDQVYIRLLNKVFFILTSNFIKTFLVAIFVLFLFYYLLGKHILKLVDFAENYGGGEEYRPFTLDRTKGYRQKDDELDLLTKSINQMVGTLKNREDDLRVYLTAVEQGPNAILLTNPEGKIEYVNKQFSEISGYSFDDVKGKKPSILTAGNTPEELYKELWKTIASGKVWRGELQNKTKNGSIYWESARIAPIFDSQEHIMHYLAIKEDITLRKSYEDKLLYQANFDTLTNLPNRLLAFDRISQAMASHHRDNGHVALLFIDLDRFKNINDTLGHTAGDELLKQSAVRLKKCVRTEDTVARLGGDEFLVILSNVKSEKNIEKIAQKILDAFACSFSIDSREVYVTSSIGISLYPDDGLDPQELLRNADAAMYKAKGEGRNNYCYFTQSMNEVARIRLELESLLRKALVNRELELHFQPIVDAKSKQIVSAEALLRWRNEILGNVPPDAFIPLAEDIGLIIPIGNWIIKTACMTAASWQTIDNKPVRIAINVSVRQFIMGDLIKVVDEALAESGLAPDCLEIEVTESLLLEDAVEIKETLQGLHNKGIRLSMDDFGTGYSSLSYLSKFPFDILKIDRSFIRDIETDPKDAELSRAIISMAHGLNLEVIGEGVETEEQYTFLKNNQINMIQGFLFSKPVPAVQLSELLKTPFRLPQHDASQSCAGND